MCFFFWEIFKLTEKKTKYSFSASTNARRERTVERNERSGSSTTDNEMPATSERTVTTHHQKKTVITSPKQRYYLGENPYGGSLFGKENKYMGNGSAPQRESEIVKQKNSYNNSQVHAPARRLRSEEPTAGWVRILLIENSAVPVNLVKQ